MLVLRKLLTSQMMKLAANEPILAAAEDVDIAVAL